MSSISTDGLKKNTSDSFFIQNTSDKFYHHIFWIKDNLTELSLEEMRCYDVLHNRMFYDETSSSWTITEWYVVSISMFIDKEHQTLSAIPEIFKLHYFYSSRTNHHLSLILCGYVVYNTEIGNFNGFMNYRSI